MKGLSRMAQSRFYQITPGPLPPGLPEPVAHLPATHWPHAPGPDAPATGAQPQTRAIPEETAIALSYGGSTHAVMMASPRDLHDFALGFSLTSGRVHRPEDLREIEVVALETGIDLRIWLSAEASARQMAHRRFMAGPTGCGLCGVDSLAAALPDLPRVADDTRFAAADIHAARAALHAAQDLHAATRAVHGAGLWHPQAGLVALREDVGRHNALDKLVGALARKGQTGAGGVLVLTSRVSVEMVQKCAVLGAPVLAAVSAPTALAVRSAEAAGITLVARARETGFDVFTGAARLTG